MTARNSARTRYRSMKLRYVLLLFQKARRININFGGLIQEGGPASMSLLECNELTG